MNPESFLQHFDEISEAPDAVSRLRRFILDLAVRGKLVAQDPGDEPAGELLNKIAAVEMPAGFPPKWWASKVGELLNIQYGKALPARDRKDHANVRVYGSNGVVGYCDSALAQEPAIIIGRKGSAGALNLCDGPSWTTDVAYFLIPPTFIDIRFLFFALHTFDLGSLSKGVKPGLSRKDAYQLSIVVPPLAEQHRIVAKVDELMTLCDELAAARAQRETRRDRLVASTLHGLNNGDDGPDACPSFKAPARFYFNHVPKFTARPEHVKQLRQTILGLAVRGRLVKQDPQDEPASELLNRINAERARLIKAGKLKGQKAPGSFDINSVPFQVPKGWAWARLQDVFLVVTDGDHQPPPKAQAGIPFLVIGNVRSGAIDFSGCRFVQEDYYETLDAAHRPANGDILFTLVGSYGIPVEVVNDFPFCVQRHIGILKPPSEISTRFLARALNSRFVFDQATRCATGIAQKTVPLAGLRKMFIPIPPLAEQHRIVAKVDELIVLCDDLEAGITTNVTVSSQFLEATLHQALGNQSKAEVAVPS